jgi:hypothetical protein
VFGQTRFSSVNHRLHDAFRSRGTLIAVHRGTGLGAIVENTAAAVLGASRAGGDVVEIDVARSLDGEFFVFHDGYEPHHFGIEQNLQTLTSAQIDGLAYRQRTVEPRARVERLDALLRAVPQDVLLNVDRSWRYWPDLFDVLDADAPDRLLLKVAADDARALATARAHPVKYPLLPIARDAGAVEPLLDDPELNVVGVELVTATADGAFCDPQWLAGLRARGIFAYVNALDLGNGKTLFAGWDDTVSILRGPENGWGRLVDLGADVIQTDWPGVLERYLVQRGVRRAQEPVTP